MEKNIQIPSLCVIGNTGAGKSSFLNSLCGDSTNQVFLASPSSDPVTNQVKAERKHWFGDTNENEILLIDTPGLGDENDEKNVYNMIEKLEQNKINAFAIVINGSNPRFDTFLYAMLQLFTELFDPKFFHNVLIIFTRWPYSKKEALIRKKNGDSEESRAKEWNEKIKVNFGFNTNRFPIPCVFLDNSYNDPEFAQISDDAEKERFMKELCSIKDFTEKANPYECKDLKKEKRFEKIKPYFDEEDHLKSTTLVNDIYTILKDFDDSDETTRLSKENYTKVLMQEVQKKLDEKVIKSMIVLLDECLKDEFGTFKNLNKEGEAIAEILGIGGSALMGVVGYMIAANIVFLSTGGVALGATAGFAALEAAAVAGATSGSMAFLSLAAATGIGLALAGFGMAIFGIVKVSWSRKTLVNELTVEIRKQILETDFRKKLQDAVKVTYQQLVRKKISKKFARNNENNRVL